ncbi:MAG TPA: endonuclease III [Thermoplasmata archaeon]|nr:endonuclease III [Thermoplasmata archaeon]
MKDGIDEIIKILKKQHNQKNLAINQISQRNPFFVLISCLLSLRTKDEVTKEASLRLFSLAKTPAEMLKLETRQIEMAIYPVGFYKRKAAQIKQICKELVEKHNSKVPDRIDELLKFKGVGRKTANIVLTVGYSKLGIAVDTHVHRISNRIGLVSTRHPDETELELKKKLPKKYWIVFNELLVLHGKNICVPISPKCSVCPIHKYCDRVGVIRSR